MIRESEKTEGQELKSMLREYDLDTGRGYSVQACATDLFKESRRQNMDHNKQLVISDKKNKTGSNIKQGSAIIEEAKRTVTKLLEEVRLISPDMVRVFSSLNVRGPLQSMKSKQCSSLNLLPDTNIS